MEAAEKRNDIIKLIAVFFMVFDHCAALFYPSYINLRIPGRIVFPIFAYYAALGARYSHDKKAYLGKLLIASILTQPIYTLLFGYGWNILFTLFYGVLSILLWENAHRILRCISIVLLVGCFFLPGLDYGWYGVYVIFLFYLAENQKFLCIIVQTILVALYYLSGILWQQAFCLLALPLLYHHWNTSITMPKYFFYWFYPGHLFLLLCLRWFMG